MDKAVFLDRDGVLIEEKHYLQRPEDVVMIPGTGPALQALQESGFRLFMVTNQSGIGRGYFTLHDVHRVHDRILAELAPFSVQFDRIFIAPEAPDQPSRGRKPSPQFLFDARDLFNIDLTRSFMVGDKLIDMECGWNAGVHKSILVRTGYGAEQEKKTPEIAERALVLDNLPAAAQWILQLQNGVV